MSRPWPSHIAVAKSPVLTIAERPVFHTAIAISSVMAASSFLITSTRMGSNVRSIVPPMWARLTPQHDIPIPIDLSLPPRRDYDRRVELFNNKRASQRLPHKIRAAQNAGFALTRARPKIRASHDLWATRSVHRPRKTLPQLAKPHATCRRGRFEPHADDGNRIVLTA